MPALKNTFFRFILVSFLGFAAQLIIILSLYFILGNSVFLLS
jgi:hypothetical protein